MNRYQKLGLLSLLALFVSNPSAHAQMKDAGVKPPAFWGKMERLLLEQIVANSDELSANGQILLAQGVSAIGAYDKAAEILDAVRKSSPRAGLPPSWEQVTCQRQAQSLLAHNYRMAKEYPKGMALFDEMIGKITAKEPRPKTPGWAFAELEIRKEKALTMEEMAFNAPKEDRFQNWVKAGAEWDTVRSAFAPTLPPLRNGALGVDRRRAMYLDLFFERKRCTVMAYKHLGVDATKGSQQALDGAFAKLAKDLLSMQSKEKNPDLSPVLKDKIKKLVDSVEELKREYVKLQVGGN